jgi:putative SOS response-associated peptidase YedK
MCGRYLLTTPKSEFEDLFTQSWDSLLELDSQKTAELHRPRYNICPGSSVLALLAQPDASRVSWVGLEWGLVPSWRKSFSGAKAMINARIETVLEKPTFRNAIQHRRCLILANGFYEWKKVGGGKEPHLIRLKSNKAFAFAGIWETWGPKEDLRQTCAILTTEPNTLVAPIHKRMPVLIPPSRYEEWLHSSALDKGMAPWSDPYPAGEMEEYAVTNTVNQTRHDSIKCLEPRLSQASLF